MTSTVTFTVTNGEFRHVKQAKRMSLLTFLDTNPCQFLVNRLRVKAFWKFGTKVMPLLVRVLPIGYNARSHTIVFLRAGGLMVIFKRTYRFDG